MHGLDLLLSRQSQLLVLRALYRAEEALTGREIERRTGLSNRATMLALENLTDLSAVHREVSSSAHLYELNGNHYLVNKVLRPAFDAEDMFWNDLARIVRRAVNPKPVAAVATGPLARDESESSGRVELTMVFSSGRKRVRAFNSMERLRDEIWDRYGLPIDSILLDISTVDRNSNDALWRRIEREGILLFGNLP